MFLKAIAFSLCLTLFSSLANAQKVIRVWHTETQANSQEAMRNIARRFEAKNPGVKVEVEGLAWGDLEGKIMASLAAGAPPELSHGQPITCSALQPLLSFHSLGPLPLQPSPLRPSDSFPCGRKVPHLL